MATATPSPSPAKPSASGNALAVILAVLLGGGMMVLMAVWLYQNHADAARPAIIVLSVIGASALLVGRLAWQVRRAIQASDLTWIERQRRLLGMLLTLIGLVLLVTSGYLAWKLRLPGLGESAGLGLFAMVPLIAGLTYLKPATSTEFMHKVIAWISLVQNAMLLVGVAGILVFLWLAFVKKIGPAWFPEVGALLFESLLCATCAFWLISSQPAERTEFSIRCLLLTFGGVTGFILVVLAAIETLVWRQDVLLGGVSAWQGDNAYRFWICAYLFLTGLLLMFTSLLLARSEIRSHAILRQALYGYNALVTGLLVLVFLGTLNVVCYAMFPMTFEWTQTLALSTISPKSKTMLNSLEKPTTVFVLLPKGHPIYSNMESLMSNCQAQTNKLNVEFISPNSDQKRFNDLAMRFPELLPSAMTIQRDESSGGRGLLVVYGAMPADITKKPPHDFIPERKLYEESPDEQQQQPQPGEKRRMLLIFKAEKELMNSLDHLVYGKENRKVYFLQGDDELDINSTQKRPRVNYAEPMSKFGAANLVDRLTKDNYKVSGLSFGRKLNDKATNIKYVNESGSEKRVDVPDDASVVVIPGASSEIPPEGLAALDRFVKDNNGKLLITMDLVTERSEQPTLKKSGIEKFLTNYGVNVEDSFVLRFTQRPGDDATLVACEVPQITENEFAKQFSLYRIPFQSVRVIRSAKGAKFKAETLLEANAEKFYILEETSMRALQAPWPFFVELDRQHMLMKRFVKEPLPVAVTVSEGEKPKMVVFGSTDFLTNSSVTPSQDGELYYSIFLSSLEWMAERKGRIGLDPKVTKNFSLGSNVEYGRMLLLPVWFMFIVTVGLGIGIWLVRRR